MLISHKPGAPKTKPNIDQNLKIHTCLEPNKPTSKPTPNRSKFGRVTCLSQAIAIPKTQNVPIVQCIIVGRDLNGLYEKKKMVMTYESTWRI